MTSEKMHPIADDAREVLDFWFGAPGTPEHGTDRRVWWRKDPAFDTEVAARFGTLVERALRGELDAWADQPESALAQILLLDQFTRNAFRDTPRAFAGDARSIEAARAMVGRQQDLALPPFQRRFVYLPFEHAEGADMQAESVRLYARLAEADLSQAEALDYAVRHQVIVDRFGRFPHRNTILGRQSTAEEIEFLRQPGSSF